MSKFALMFLLAVATFSGRSAEACSHSCGPTPMPMYGYGVGRYGAIRPAYYGPYGRYPKLGFAAPIRRAHGLPGFTPVRQFAFGRGAIRRVNRRAFVLGHRHF